MDSLQDLESFRMRLAFGSDGDLVSDTFFFSFKDVSIKSRNRNVLMERFTDCSNLNFSFNEEMVAIADANNLDVISLQYHTFIDTQDQVYLDNPLDASARVAHFGISQNGTALIDGKTDNFVSLDPFTRQSILDREMLGEPRLEVEITVVDAAHFEVAFQNIDSTLDFSKLRIQSVIIEKTLDCGNAQHNVVRKMVPDAGGTPFTDWTSAGLLWPTVGLQYEDANQLALVVFVENIETKEVYNVAQRDIALPLPTHLTEVLSMQEFNMQLSPNPNEGTFSVRWEQGFEAISWNLYDLSGKVRKQGVLSGGQTDVLIAASDLPDGIYLFTLASNAGGFTSQVFVVD